MSDSTRHEFKAEISQLLDILVHSVYTSKDIFVRELVSNATDALEKVRFAQVRGEAVFQDDAPLEISIDSREEGGAKVLTIADTGVGMTADEIRENLGTIAHSGAAAFLEQVRGEGESPVGKEGDEAAGASDDVSLIGRFGVGFYSVFMAAKKVVVTSRSKALDATAVCWTSDGLGSYTVADVEDDVNRGTRIEVWLREDEDRFADLEMIKGAVKKYSNFVPFPIRIGDEAVNAVTALWREQPSATKDEQYKEFFEYLTFPGNESATHLHFSVDVPLQFSALLFVPKANAEMFGFGEREVSLQLYVKRVLIDGENKDLLPKYLRFVTGVVESEDLPLNVSRETLQENSIVIKIRDTLTRKLLGCLLELAEKNPDEYGELWRTFGIVLKEGHSDFPNREKFAELLRFNSSTCDDEKGLVSLAEYVARMSDDQKAIYYLTGASREALLRDPRLEVFRKNDIEVLYLTDVSDEFVLGNLGEYAEKQLVSADQVKPEDLRFGSGADEDDDGADDASEASAVDIAALAERFKDVLGDRVTDVRASERLVDSPACLVNEDGMSSHMDRVFRHLNKDTDLPKRVLELNAKHPLVHKLAKIFEADRGDDFLPRACEQIFEGAMLLDGYLSDPHELVELMKATLEDAAGGRLGAAAEESPSDES